MQAGCTAVVALIVRDQLFVANAGDSRAVLCRGGKAVPMSGAQGGANERGQLDLRCCQQQPQWLAQTVCCCASPTRSMHIFTLC